MASWITDPTPYPPASTAMAAPTERLAYVTVSNPDSDGRPDALAVLDVDPASAQYGTVTSRLDVPYAGDELHHAGWSPGSAAPCPNSPHPHPHPHLERRYLLLPGLRSSRMYVVDTRPDPRRPTLAKIIEPDELVGRSGYSRPHTIRSGPDAIYVSALGARDGKGPGGIFRLDHDFNILGQWEKRRGPQVLAYDFGWHPGHDAMVTSEWGTPCMVEHGVQPELLLRARYGHQIHVWDVRRRSHVQALDLGAEHQMVLGLRPSHDPGRTHGFVGVVTSLKDLSASVWLWYREGARWAIQKVITIPAEPADPSLLPPLLRGFSAVPPLVTDINLSPNDRFLYVSCWGTGQLQQYDVSEPFSPKLIGSVRLGGIARKAAHPTRGPLNGGPQMVKVSRDGRRVYLTNALYAAWDAQFYPEGIRGWAVKLDAGPGGGLRLDPSFFVDFGRDRPHQVLLQGGDASSDSFCWPG